MASVVRKAGTKTKNAAVCVAGSSVITKVISMPSGLSDDDMEGQIQIEADQHIPFPLDQVAIDFEVNDEPSKDDGNVNVLLAAARTEIVDNVVASLELGGLKAKIVDIEAFTIENTVAWISENFPAGVSKDVIAVADIGSRATTFSVLEGLKVVYSRDEAIGGVQLIEEIQRRYSLSFEEASIARKQGKLPDDYESEVLEPFKENLVSEPCPPPFIGYNVATSGEVFPVAEIKVREDGRGYGGQFKFEMLLHKDFAPRLEKAQNEIYGETE